MAYKIVFDNGKEKITEESIIEIANKYSDFTMIKKLTKEDTLIEYARALKETCSKRGERCEGCVFDVGSSFCKIEGVPLDWEV